MHKKTLTIANAQKLREALAKVLDWLESNGNPCQVNTSCSRPVLMTYKEQKNANCWVMIMFDREYKSIKFSISNGVKVPAAQILRAQEFIDTIKRNAFTPLDLDLDQFIIWAAGALRIDGTDFGDDDIACVFNTICKAVDDSTPPFLSLIYGNKAIEDAVADFETAQKISISEWSANEVCLTHIPSDTTCSEREVERLQPMFSARRKSPFSPKKLASRLHR